MAQDLGPRGIAQAHRGDQSELPAAAARRT
jgi:hypothetical protein